MKWVLVVISCYGQHFCSDPDVTRESQLFESERHASSAWNDVIEFNQRSNRNILVIYPMTLDEWNAGMPWVARYKDGTLEVIDNADQK